MKAIMIFGISVKNMKQLNIIYWIVWNINNIKNVNWLCYEI